MTRPLLRFSRAASARYELDTGVERGLHLRQTILIGLLFYNASGFATFLLMPDVLVLALVLRLLVVTPVWLLLAWSVTRVGGAMRERLVTAGMLGAVAVPILLFGLSRHPLSGYGYLEYPLMLVFGGMMLVLRFPHALIVTGAAAAMSLASIAGRSDIHPELAGSFAFQTVTASFFVLYGNFQIEAVRRGAYIVSLREILRSIGLENDRRTLTTLSETDPLTGLANRRALDAGLAALTDAMPVQTALLMIDVDHFKRFNDSYGHPRGDDCLRAVATALAEETRGSQDLVARYGGEEFSILMRGCDDIEVERIARRLFARIARLGIAHHGRGDGLQSITVSIGVAVLSAGHRTRPGELLAVADAALYEAKRSGRNRHVVRWVDDRARAAA
ncbi:GGDEF domain-containing protein [Methylobacterium sp. BTF04]|uniref:GGDEF domain-containing protein n=1 Tax=Methylobacterium sp. BTF04 TaxID=2708300 RepID=UPI0013CFC8EC|nr:GGDEF domain-containing protein [Methylobacterium sp. BTF04]NEU11453.1 GGDEF domain-containing protein [Methylobacterium sp. BTF04]